VGTIAPMVDHGYGLLDGSARTVLVAMALLEAPSPSLLAHVVERPLPEVVAVLDDAIAAGVVIDDGSALRFAKGDAGSPEILQSFSPTLIRAMHRQVAIRLAVMRAAPKRVAHHWVLGKSGGDPHEDLNDDIASYLHQAAGEVRPQSLSLALQWFQCAIDATPAGTVRTVREAEFASLLLLAGRIDDALALCDRVLGPGPGPLSPKHEVAVRGVRAAIFSISGPTGADSAIEQFELIMALLDKHAYELDPQWVEENRAEALAGCSIVEVYRGALDRAESLAEQAIEVASVVGANGAMSRAHETLALVALAQDRVADARSEAEAAVAWSEGASSQWAMLVPARLTLALVAVSTGSIDEAIDVCSAGLLASDASGHVLAQLYLLACSAAFHLTAGHLDTAVELSRHTETVVGELCPSHPTPVTTGILGFVAMLRGDMEEATKQASRALGEVLRSGTQLAIADVAIWLVASVFEANDRAADARGLLTMVWEAIGERTGAVVIASDLVRLCLATQPQLAERVIETLELRADATGTTRLLLAARRTRAIQEGDVKMLDHVADEYEAAGVALTAAFTARDAALAAIASRNVELATDIGRAAVRRFERLDAPGAAGRLRGDLRALGIALRPGRGRVGTGLSVTERQVAQLASAGLTNRQIGQHMHISGRTVESHLSHVFALLQVTNRVELTAAVLRDPTLLQ
jgi:DNA-binding CsgD family transcriptional regulator/tetratricopeptide (TPR) repeat protein